MSYAFSLCELYCGLVAVCFLGLVVAFAVLTVTLIWIIDFNAVNNRQFEPFSMIALPLAAFILSIGAALWVIQCSSKVFDRFHRGVGLESGTFNSRRNIHLIPLLIVHRAQNVSRLLAFPMGLFWLTCFFMALFVRHSVNDFFGRLEVSDFMYALLVAVTYLSFVFACNIYLALAMGVMFRNRFLTRMIWRSRFVFDFLVVMVAMFG